MKIRSCTMLLLGVPQMVEYEWASNLWIHPNTLKVRTLVIYAINISLHYSQTKGENGRETENVP